MLSPGSLRVAPPRAGLGVDLRPPRALGRLPPALRGPSSLRGPGSWCRGLLTGLQQGSRVRVSVSSVEGAAVFPGIKINREDSSSMTNNVGLLIKKHKCDLAQNRPLVCRATKLDHGNE